MKIIEVVQGSPEWLLARCGLPTASEFDNIVDSTGKPSKQRSNYLYRLAGERITGRPEATYQNGAMQRGNEMEPEARIFYEMMTSETVKTVGFCLGDGYGASPDALVGKDGILEIKCPLLATHVSNLMGNKIPTKYFQQVQGELLVTGRKWCDFISYYPAIRPLVIRVEPDPDFQSKLKSELEAFCQELDETVKKLREVAA